MEHDHETELLKWLATEVAAGVVSVTDETPVIDRLHARFPMGFNGIDWEKVPGSIRHRPKPQGVPIEAYTTTMDAFLGMFAATASIGNDDAVTVIGDGLTSLAFVMPLGTLRRHLELFLRIPQGTYIVKSDAEWCFNYTFEDDAYFGRAVQP